MNNQEISKQNLILNGGFERELEVTEVFQTIQGEGPFSGAPANFIRLAGCNLKCTWCDTDYTTTIKMTVQDIVKKLDTGIQLIVITGGEPFRQNISGLVDFLYQNGFIVQIETNGTLSIPDFPWKECVVVCSPKTPKIHSDFMHNCKYFKYVVGSEDIDSPTGTPVMSTQGSARDKSLAEPPKNALVYYTPRDDYDQEKNKTNLEATKHLCFKYGRRINLQIHKIIGIQ